jgi:hypothetical protein
MVHHFDFRFGDENAGYQVYEQLPERLAIRTRFMLDAEVFEASHEVELEDGRPLRFRADDGEWFAAADYEGEVWPTAGVPLLLERMHADGLDRLDYQAIDESTGQNLGLTQLRREGDWIVEEQDGEITRRFQVDEVGLLRADWDGPISTRCASAAEARAGSVFEVV